MHRAPDSFELQRTLVAAVNFRLIFSGSEQADSDSAMTEKTQQRCEENTTHAP